MNRGHSDRDAVRLGLLGIAGVIVALAAAVNIARIPLIGGGETFRAEFADTSGLQVGEEVRVAGVKVGEVTALELDRGKVLATFTIRGEELGDETSASIEVKTLLGQHYVSLRPEGDDPMSEGDTIPLDRTTTPLDIVPAVEGLTGRTDQIDTRRVAEALDAVSGTLDAATPQARQLLDGLGRLSEVVSSREQEFRGLLQHTSRVAGVVADRDADLTALLRDTTDVLAVLDRRRSTITRLIRGTLRLSDELAGMVGAVDDDLGPVLDDLGEVLDVLIDNRRNLDDVITYAALYSREFVNVAGTGPWFDTTVTLPSSLSVCTPGGGPLSGLVDSALHGLTQLLYGSAKDCLPLGVPERDR